MGPVSCLVVFVDLKSAYDTVWKEKLILKLSNYGICSKMLKWFQSFLSTRSCRVKYGSSFSKNVKLQVGLPQGAVTSCSLFNIYVNDLVKSIKSVEGIHCLLYADDLVLWHETPKRNAEKATEAKLNQALDKIAQWCDDNALQINLAKTAYQSFSLAHTTINPKLKIKEMSISKTDQYTYLGMTLDNKLTWKAHIDKITTRASKRLTILKRLAGSKWGCARSTLNLTYKTFVLPLMIYCCESIVTASQQTLKNLILVHNQALRLITGGTKSTPIDAMLLLTGNSPLDVIINEKTLLLYEKVLRIPNENLWSNYKTENHILKHNKVLSKKQYI